MASCHSKLFSSLTRALGVQLFLTLFLPSKYFPSFEWFYLALVFPPFFHFLVRDACSFWTRRVFLMAVNRQQWVFEVGLCFFVLFLGSVLCFPMLFFRFIFSLFQLSQLLSYDGKRASELLFMFLWVCVAWPNIFKGGILKISHE